ncbi:Cell division inhibitor [Fulvivirga imtechensis AK7]|uniref:Cell division inhibitor n=1 Tax=Fulvivirga imtechensis AK7 TaxID=1237149 RepID=L8JNU5_9BACT|nr:SRPBCC family protein [Fulvivirga imtechensis]ELR70636.1 Cell division inhibitor [Fulvivirga imtechensis AK7]
MKIYNLKRAQILPISLAEAWQFFSTPKNLQKITPPHMGFKIKYLSGNEKMYPGQLILYKINILPGIPVDWATEITHVVEPYYFVDEQRFGPYKLWHHQHHFREAEQGVEMTDEVNYAIPLGFIGRMANSLFVRRQVEAIFDHRHRVLENYFAKKFVTV